MRNHGVTLTEVVQHRTPVPEPQLSKAIIREEGYRERTLYFRHLRPEDENLPIAEAMGFLALVIGEAPQEMAREREQLAEILARSVEAMQAARLANMRYHQQLEERLTQLPAEIAQRFSAEAIAAKLSESLR